MNVFFLLEAAFSISSYFQGTWEIRYLLLLCFQRSYHLPYL